MRFRMEYERRYYLLLPVEIVLTICTGIKKFFFHLAGFKPRYNSWWYDRLDACKTIRETAERKQTALSLNVVYNYKAFGPARNFDEWLERLWMKMPSAQAVRNRKAIVTELLDDEVRSVWSRNLGKPVNVVFLAGGFVQTGIAVAVDVRKDGIQMKCVVLDISRKALDYAAERAEKAGVGDVFTFVRINLLDTEKVQAYLSDLDVHVVEMIGILDYLTDPEVIQIFRVAKSSMRPDGKMLTGNILPRCLESPFLHTVINWPRMYHRTYSQLTHLLYGAGFITEAEEIDKYVEPHKVFMVLQIRNPVSAPLTSMELVKAQETKYQTGSSAQAMG